MESHDPARHGSVGQLADGRSYVIFDRLLPYIVEEVWDAITHPQRLQTWFPGIQIEPRTGGSFKIWFSDDHNCEPDVSGEVSVFEPPHHLKLGSVSYDLEATSDGCLLRFTDILVMSGSRSNEWITNSVLAGWHQYLDRLEGSLHGEQIPEGPELDYSAIKIPGREQARDSPRYDEE